MKNQAVRGESEMMKLRELRKVTSDNQKLEKLKREPMGRLRCEEVV